jgi:hypothetical protein
MKNAEEFSIEATQSETVVIGLIQVSEPKIVLDSEFRPCALFYLTAGTTQ